MKKIIFSFLIISNWGFSQGQFYTVETVPNPKPIDNSYVSNPDTILSDAAVAKINNVLTLLENQTTVQTAVVVIRSIGDADIFDFAQQLFEYWGIGHAGNNNGLLVLLVLNQRTVRFHTGFGLEGVLPDILCKQIEMEQMVPQFKVEDYDAGMIAGIEEVAYILNNPSYGDELKDKFLKESNGWNLFFIIALIVGGSISLILYLTLHFNGSFAGSGKNEKRKKQYAEMRPKRIQWIIANGIIPFGLLLIFNNLILNTENHIFLFLVVLYFYFILLILYKRIRMNLVVDRLVAKKDYYRIVEFLRYYQGFWLVMAILFPFPILFLYIHYLGREKFYRNHPRNCKTCGHPLQKLDEKADDQHLEKKQVMEEELDSVDYDVWICSTCQSKEIWNYINRSSKYKGCPVCKTWAFYKESDRTIVSPTYTSTGSGEITKRCKFCNHLDISSYTISKLTPPSSSSSSSGNSGGSSSSGGSWGGGSSGGGGASSSW